jgi:Predicted PP-loop superfamily ATPase
MKSKKKVVLLLSAGLDSAVNAFEAIKHHHEIVLALTFNYGQRAAQKEIECSKKLADYLKIPHKVVELPWFKDLNKSSLLVESQLSRRVPLWLLMTLKPLNKPQSCVGS